MNTDDLSPELKAKTLECKTPEEMMELAQSEGFELSDEQLEAVAGGAWDRCNKEEKPQPAE